MTSDQTEVVIRGRIRLNERLARYTSWRVGGPADRLFEPVDVDDLAMFMRTLEPGESLTFIGLGSNLLIRDGGIRGTVISTRKMSGRIELDGKESIRAGAGVACARIARFAARKGLAGAEFLVGIPGTLGGALAMNAGAFGAETWSVVTRVMTIDRLGNVHERPREAYRAGYRSLVPPVAEEWFIQADLALTVESVPGAAAAHMQSLLERRSASQPIGEPSCGSVFRNPDGAEPAARLIEACGLKGYRIGMAQVSEKHANFIINTGAAKAADMEALIQHVRSKVRDRYGVDLIPEVRILGEAL